MGADGAYNPTLTDRDFTSVAASYRAELADRAEETEQLRKLPQDIADRLSQEGLYAMCNPPDYGGAGASPADYVRAVETLALGDASPAWCTFIAITSAYGMAFVQTDTVRSLLNQPGVITAGVFAPMGRARKTKQDGEDGYIVSGRWAWGSGTQNAHWVSGGCFLTDEGGELLLSEDGKPRQLAPIFAASQLDFVDTWSVAGLQGTGSTDFQVNDVFVPADRVIQGFGAGREDDPIFRFPGFGLLGMGIAAVALGAARGAMEDFQTFAGAKVPAGTRSKLAEKSGTQRDFALAEASIRQGRAFFMEAIETAWEAAQNGHVSVELRRDLRLATTAAVRSARTAVDLVYDLAGGTAVYRTSPIQRRFRDIHVATQHMMVKPATYELAGRLLLGQPADTSQL